MLEKNLFSFKKGNFMAPFYGGGSIIWKLKSHWEDGLLAIAKSPGVPGTPFINLGRMKDWVDLGATE